MTEFVQPGSIQELQALLPQLPARTAVLAGGTDLMPKIRSQHPDYDCMLSLWGIPELRGIEEQDGWLRIGAMVTHAMAAADASVGRYFAGLQMACSHVGSQQIRNKGTLCGSLINASPAGDIMPCVFLYGGEVEILGVDGSRRVAAQAFLNESGKPVMAPNEILLAIWLPIDPERKSCFVKLGSRREVTIAQISICAAWKDREGQPDICCAYVGAIDRRPLPFPNAALLGSAATAEAAAAALRDEIRAIRQRRSRPPKLKITEAEQLYKERAARGVVYDAMASMGVLENH